MIAVRVGPDLRMAVVGSPACFQRHPKPKSPHELTRHSCITIRLPTHGGIYAWGFEKKGQELKVRVEGRLVFNNIALRLGAALEGLGLAYMPEDLVRRHVQAGMLVYVMQDCSPSFPGYHLYYPSRRQSSPAFTLLRDALRYPG